MNKDGKIQKLYSIRSEVYNEINNMSILPEEVKSIIYKAFQKIDAYYQESGLNSSEISKYIYGNYEETIADINKGKEIDRRGLYWKQIDNLFDYLEEKILYEEEIQTSDVEYFEVTDDKRNSIVNGIVEFLNDKLKDVQYMQNKLMGRRGFDDKKIEDVNNEIMAFIRNFIKDNEANINIAYEKREEQLTSEVIDKVLEKINELNFTEKTQEEGFREGLSIDLPLEKQRENAQRFTEAQKGSNRDEKDGLTPDSLPTDLIQ